MADYADPLEIDSMERKYAEYPDISETGRFCYRLGIKKDNLRTIRKEDAWEYYRELKAMVEAMERKTA